MADHILTLDNEEETALAKAATDAKVTVDKFLAEKIKYYIACDLFDRFPPSHPLNIPGLSIGERLKINAAVVNGDRDAGFLKADELIATRPQ